MSFYLLIILFLCGWGGLLGWRWKKTRDFAPQLLALRQESGEIPATVDVSKFTALYVRAEGPRAGTYLCVSAAFMTVSLPPLSGFFNMVWNLLWQLSGGSPVFEEGTLIHTFSFFLAFMLVAISVLAIAMQRYYALMPPTLRQVLNTLKESRP